MSLYLDPLNKLSLENMCPCVKKAFDEGSGGFEFGKMLHAIACELKRLEYPAEETKEKLLEWNKRCERPVGLNEQGRRILKYVDWVYKKEAKTGCKALKDFCIGEDGCWYHQRKTSWNLVEAGKLPFDMNELEGYLKEKYPGDSYVLILIVKMMRRFQIEKQIGSLIYISFRIISSMIRSHYKNVIEPMQVSRHMNKLIDENVIEKVEKGKRGSFSPRANGYRFMPWRCPEHGPNAQYPTFVTHI